MPLCIVLCVTCRTKPAPPASGDRRIDLRIALSIAAAAVAFSGTSTLSTTSAMANGLRPIDQRGWGNGSAGSQRGFRNRLTIYQDGSRNSALSRQYGNQTASC